MTSHKILFILGAGASVSSGLPTYRGNGGIYSNNGASKTLSIDTLKSDPRKVWELIREIHGDDKDLGKTYYLLDKIFLDYPESFVVTQNIDGLIQRTGIPKDRIWEIHGQARTMRCNNCKKVYPTNFDDNRCPCGWNCRPNVVLYGESIDEVKYNRIKGMIRKEQFDYVVIVGTTFNFGYLEELVMVAKQRGCRNVININPDLISVKWKLDHWPMTSDDGLDKLCQILDH